MARDHNAELVHTVTESRCISLIKDKTDMWFEVPMGNSLHRLLVNEAHKIHTTYGGSTLEAYLTMNIILEHNRHNIEHIKQLNIEHTIKDNSIIGKVFAMSDSGASTGICNHQFLQLELEDMRKCTTSIRGTTGVQEGLRDSKLLRIAGVSDMAEISIRGVEDLGCAKRPSAIAEELTYLQLGLNKDEYPLFHCNDSSPLHRLVSVKDKGIMLQHLTEDETPILPCGGRESINL